MWYVEDQALSVACHIDILEATFTLRNINFQTKLVEEIFFAWFFKVQIVMDIPISTSRDIGILICTGFKLV